MTYRKDNGRSSKKITSAQMRAARALLRWTALDLAIASRVGVATIRRVEVIDGEIPVTLANEAAIRMAFEVAGIAFIGQYGVASAPLTESAPSEALSMPEVSIAAPNLSIRKVSVSQIKAARALLGWSQEQLAVGAIVSVPTVKRLESQDGPLGGRSETVMKIRSALEAAGIEFIQENGGGPGVRFRKRQAKKEPV